MRNFTKILFSFFLFSLFTPLFLSAGLPYAHLNNWKENRSDFITDKLINNETINYCIYIGAEDRRFNSAQLDEQVKFAFKAWTTDIAEAITKSGRAEEFKDITAILQKPVKLNRMEKCDVEHILSANINRSVRLHIPPQSNKADLPFIADRKFCTAISNDGASFFYEYPSPFICLNAIYVNSSNKPSYQAYRSAINGKIEYLPTESKGLDQDYKSGDSLYTLIHELGHAIGLADQYKEGLSNNDRIYKSHKPGNGIMACEGKINCDEIDGIITLFDRARNTKRTFKSFCNSKITFTNGIQLPEIFKPDFNDEKLKNQIQESAAIIGTQR